MKKRIAISLLFLIIGVLIYFIFDIGIIEKTSSIKSIIKNYFSDYCWSTSLFFIGIIFMSNITKKPIIYNSIYTLLISLLFEFLQLNNIVGGTFDILDILTYIISIMIALLFEKYLRRKENEKI